MLRAVSDYSYMVKIELSNGETEEHTKCASPGYNEHFLFFKTLDGAQHLFNMDYVIGFWYKQQEND